MSSLDLSAALLAQLPEGLPDVHGLPSLDTAARALFEARLPGVLDLDLYLLQLGPADESGQRAVLAARSLFELLQQARQGQPAAPGDFEPADAALSLRADAVQLPEALPGLTLKQLREALQQIDVQRVAARWAADAATYWDVPQRVSENSRRLALQIQVRQSLRETVELFAAAGWIAPEAVTLVEDIVAHPRLVDRSTRRGVYALVARTWGDGQEVLLPGVMAVCTEPAGYQPALGRVTERQTLTGTTVLYCTGYFGFVRAHAHLQEALHGVAMALAGQGPWLQALLRRLGAVDQARILGERARLGGGFELFARPIDDNPFEALAEQQIAAWRSNAMANGRSLWNPQLGLDASPPRALHDLQAFVAHRQALRAQLPMGLRELTATRQAQLDALILSLLEQQAQAERFWLALPSFETFAGQRIADALAARGLAIDPAQVKVMITITQFSAETIGSELAPGVEPERGHVQPSVVECTLVEYLAMRMHARADASWQVQFEGLTLVQAARLNASYLETLGQQLDLPGRYAQLLTDAMRPTTQAGFEASRTAALSQFETRLRLDALLANACGVLDDSGHRQVLEVLAPSESPRSGARVEGLAIGGNSLRDVLVFSIRGESSILCYLPDHPSGQPFRRCQSRSALVALLRQELAGIGMPSAWQATLRYWLSRFGKHQQAAVHPLLRLIAEGKGGAQIATVVIDKPLAQQVFDYRLAFLAAEADSLALSEAELALERGLEIAVAIFRLLSVVFPARVMTVLDLAELGYYLFNGYAAYAQGQRQEAGEYVIQALTSITGLANARFPTLIPAARAQAPVRLQSVGARLSLTPVPSSAPMAGLVRIETGVREGLFAADGKLHVRLDGRYYRVYEVHDSLEGISRFYLGDGQGPLARSLFSNPDTRVERMAGSPRWHVMPKLQLRAGMPMVPVGRAPALLYLRGINSSQVPDGVEHRLHDGQRSQLVYFDLDTCRWYSADNRLFYEYDALAARHRSVTRPTRLPSELERQQARYELECVDRPVLPMLKSAALGEAVPKAIHQIWIGSAAALIAAHDATLKSNVALARQSGYSLQVHFLGEGGRLRTLTQLTRLRLRYPGATFVSLAGEAFYTSFKASAQGRVFDAFLQPQWRNHAAASDVLRYRLLFELGGVYLDMDDRLLKPLETISLRPGQLAVGAVVENYLLMLKGPNNSHFASLAGNPLLDAMQAEIVRRFDQARLPEQRPLHDQPGFTAYMREISAISGPRLFNDMRHLADVEIAAVDAAKGYVFDLIGQGVFAEREVMQWIETAEVLHPTLERFIDVGNAHSWRTTRR